MRSRKERLTTWKRMLKCSLFGGTQFVGSAVNNDIFIGRKEKKGDNDVTVSMDTLCTFSTTVCAIAFGRQYFAASCEDKSLTVWQISDWSTLSHTTLPKKVTSLLFSNDDEYILTADKVGDVIRYSVKTLQPTEPQLLGHSSMLLDITLIHCASGDFIATCDRDEKIRISHYPNSYNIHSFCLGHTDFVSRVCICLQYQHLLLSGSADNTVKVWDWYNGKLLQSVTVIDGVSQDKDGTQPIVTNLCCTVSDSETPLVAVTTSNSVYLYTFNDTSLLLKIDSIEFNGNLLSCSFESTYNRLWVLYSSGVQSYIIIESKANVVVNEVLVDMFNEVLSKIDNIKEVYEWASLRIHKFDNMSTYYTRKAERITSNKKMKLDSPEQSNTDEPLDDVL